MKVDRLISIKITNAEGVTVPKGEMWKLMPYGNTPKVNGESGIKNTEFIAVENDVITIDAGTVSTQPTQLSGLAFTI